MRVTKIKQAKRRMFLRSMRRFAPAFLTGVMVGAVISKLLLESGLI